MDTEDILAGVPSEGEAVTFATEEEQKETETPTESPTETNEAEEEPSGQGENTDQEEKIPSGQESRFDKHPRWIARERKMKEMEATLQQLQEQVSARPSASSEDGEELPSRFVQLYGDSKEAWKLYREEQQAFKSELLNELRSQQQQEVQAERQALEEGSEYVDLSLQSLKDEGADFNENELMKFMVDLNEKYGVLPLDEENNIDFSKGLSMFQEFKQTQDEDRKASVRAKKSIASFTTSPSRSENASQGDFVTSNDLRNMDWDQAVGR